MAFAVYNPLAPQTESRVVRAHLDPQDRKRVMIIQSDLEVADILAHQVEAAGYIPHIVTDGRHALCCLDGHNASPDLILLDSRLSDMTGAHLTEILRAAGAYAWRLRHVPILYVVDRTQVVNSRFIDAPEVPFTNYIVKPIQPKELSEKMNRAFSNDPQASPLN